MRASRDTNAKGSFIKIYYEGYAEIFLASGLTCVCLMSTIDADSFTIWFMTGSDATNSILSLVSMFILLIIPLWVFYLGKRLQTPEYIE